MLGKDVRQVLTYVETGNADAGLVYATDAQTSGRVRVVAVAPDSSHDPIVYPAAVGVWIGQSSGNTIAHNEISNIYHSGIGVGWTWGYLPTAASSALMKAAVAADVGIASTDDGLVQVFGRTDFDLLRFARAVIAMGSQG